MNLQIPYFIYTSGERGLNGIDWGVKFASPFWADPKEVESIYRILTESYGLNPSLRRTDSDEPSVLLLPVPSEFFQGYLLGFIFPYHDSDAQGNRPNISLVGCMISTKTITQFNLTPRQLCNSMWQIKGFATLGYRQDARHQNFLKRPDYIEVNLLSGSDNLEIFSLLKEWPKQFEGLWSINTQIVKLQLSEKKGALSPDFRNDHKRFEIPIIKNKWVLGVGFVIIIFLSFIFFSNNNNPNFSESSSAHQTAHQANYDIQQNVHNAPREENDDPELLNLDLLKSVFSVSIYETFESAALLRPDQINSLTQGGMISYISMFSFENKNVEVQKQTFKSVSSNRSGFFINPDVIGCLLKKMVTIGPLEYNTAKNDYYPVEIKSRYLSSKQAQTQFISSNISSCGGIRIQEINPVRKNTVLDFPQTLNEYIKSMGIEKDISELTNRLVFISPTAQKGIFKVYYYDNDPDGKLVPKSSIFISDNIKIKYTEQTQFSDYLGSLFTYLDSQKSDVWRLSNKKLNDELIRLINNKKQENDSQKPQVARLLPFF